MQLENIISNLKTMLPAQDFILTGSFVLAKYGLRSWDSVNDLDIILVKPENNTIEMINQYMKDFPAPSTAQCNPLIIPAEDDVTTKEDSPDKKAMFVKATKSTTLSIFMFDGVKVDIYIENGFNESNFNCRIR